MNPPKVLYKSLVDQVMDALIELIETRNLKPGDKLPSTLSLVKEFGVSRPVIREALKTLEGRGIIQSSNGRSAIIQPASGEILQEYFRHAVRLAPTNLQEVLEIRYGIEVQSARLAALRIQPEQLVELQNLVHHMRQHINNPETFTELDLHFHELIANATHNQLMKYLVSSIRDSLRDTIREGLAHRLNEDERLLVQTTHEKIVDAIASRNPEKAGAAMAFHFDDALRAIFEPQNS